MSYWSVVQTETQREHIARMWMMRLGYETWAPRIKVNRKRVALLFPNYVFVRIVERWYPITWTPGVVRVLMNGDQPARLRDQIITDIRKNEVRGFIKLPPKEPKRGSRMKIIRGPLQGRPALFDGMTTHERQRLLLDMLGQVVPVELPRNDAVLLDVAQ